MVISPLAEYLVFGVVREKSIILNVSLRFPKNIGVFDRKAIYVDDITLTTLSGNTKSSQLTISHNGGISNFKTTIKAQTDDTEIELDASFKSISTQGSC
jgi:hypothetical protein